MPGKVAKIEYLFPLLSSDIRSTDGLVREILSSMRSSGSIEYAGYMEDEELQKDLQERIGSFNQNKYQPLSQKKKEIFSEIVLKTISECHKVLHLPESPIFIFVYPWFPTKNEDKALGGVNAFAVHEKVLHLFVSANTYNETSLSETIAHEYNHLAFYQLNPKNKYSLGENILMEGLAEVYREEVVGGVPAPWAIAVSKTDVDKLLKPLQSNLTSYSKKLSREVMYGGGDYKEWTGYSIGYWLMKEFRNKHPELSWKEILNTPVKSFFPQVN